MKERKRKKNVAKEMQIEGCGFKELWWWWIQGGGDGFNSSGYIIMKTRDSETEQT
ncbi:unnamed protein product [Lactuca virosa]|uniref:Uncharacterized protein n=1 Tax=Lactuca virosa TaxID=75947 RepID=A0AAU9PH23_9ASTR|nr:unnamed protein product [Lactuca virosa]